MDSVLTQTSRDFEYIIIDGDSTDRSVDVIKRLIQSTNQPINFISEPDSGIYNAMNKGIRMAKGEYVHFLNSGDWLVDECVVEFMLSFIENQEPRTKNQEPKGTDILIGDVISIRPDGKRRYDRNSKSVSLYTFYRGTIQHTSAYIRRSLFDKYGFYDESLKIVSDWKWYMIAVLFNGATVRFTELFVTCFDRTGISSTQLDLDKAERRNVLEELIPAPILADYDRYSFDIEQMERLKKYPLLYRIVWFIERCLFKLDKWQAKYWSWEKRKP